MIYTVTFNPSVDYAVYIDKLKIGITNRSVGEKFYFGGKGINVSLVLKELNKKSVALGFVAGFTGNAIENGIKNKGIDTNFIHLKDGNSRVNIKIMSNEETEINCQGPEIPPDATEKLFSIISEIQDGDALILAGSVPNSLPQDIYEQILNLTAAKKLRCVVDASKKLLLNTLKYNPFLIKPNKQELEEIFSVKIDSPDDVIKYGHRLRKMGALNVLISLGENGAVLIDEHDEIHEEKTIECKTVCTVGAGDSMVAGFLAGYLDSDDYGYALKLGTACGAATASLPGLATKEKIDEMMEYLTDKNK